MTTRKKPAPARQRLFVALMGDVISSRELAGARRSKLQKALRASMTEVNARWKGAIAAGFAVTGGDQFQGLLKSAADVWDITHWLRDRLREVDWTVACAKGTISTALAPWAPEVDGPCFHLASQALQDAKKQRLLFGFPPAEPILQGLADYYSALYWTWTSRQREVATLLRVHSQLGVAEQLNKSPSAVSHLAGRIEWKSVRAGDEVFRQYLGRL
jgi:hypothetical protein